MFPLQSIYMFIIICLFILHNKIPESFFLGKFVLYLPCTWVIIKLHHHHIYVHFDIFLHMIYVYALISLFISYNIIRGCTPSWEVCSICLLCAGYSTTVSSIYLNFYWCVCAYYIYVYSGIFAYYVWSNTWLYLILVRFAYSFPVYHYSSTVSPS